MLFPTTLTAATATLFGFGLGVMAGGGLAIAAHTALALEDRR